MKAFLFLCALVLCCLSTASAVDVNLRGVKDGTYTLEVSGGGTVVKLTNATLHDVSGKPTVPNPPPADPPPPPGNPNPTAFELQIQKLTQAALDRGGSKTTGAGLSEIYSRAAAGVADGSLPLDKSFVAIRDTTTTMLAFQREAEEWAAWDKEIDGMITTWRAQAKPKEYFVKAFGEIASGTNLATGYKGAVHYPAAKGILGGINIEQLLKLLALIEKIMSLFGL